MENDNSESHEKLWFPRRLRELRLAANKKQREIAVVLGIRDSSYANAESSNHKRISRDRVVKLGVYYRLTELETAELLAGWEALPQSDYNAQQEKTYEKRKAFRSKARNHDRLKLALLELTTLLVTSVDDPDTLCTCETVDMFSPEPQDTQACELCNALHQLGLSGWTNSDDVLARLAEEQGKLES